MRANPRIIVLDGYTLNPDDLSWDGLKALGETIIYDRTAPEQRLERARGAELLLTNKVVIDRLLMDQLPELKYIGVLATGYNVVDLKAAAERGIVVTNVPDYSTPAVAQMTFALLLELTHRVGRHSQSVKSGRWSASPDFCFWEHPLLELDGLVMGIIGLGRIGRAAARIAQAFGMRVIGHDPKAGVTPPGIAMKELDDIFRLSDVVSMHCPLTGENRGVVNARRLALMKPGSLFLNTARGPLVDEEALAAALRSGRPAGAGLDVLTQEPPRPDNPLLTAPNCFITPHISWATKAARQRLMATVVENARAFLSGAPRNTVTA